MKARHGCRAFFFLMRRLLLPAAAVLVAAALIAASIRIQPAGTARVVRSAYGVSVHAARIAFVSPFGASCIAPRRGDQLFFQRELQLPVDGGDVLDVTVNFAYDPPAQITAAGTFPEGDWCGALEKFVDQSARAAGHKITSAALNDPRSAETLISEQLQQSLTAAGVRTSSVSARLALPPEWQRTRPVPEVAAATTAAPPVIFVGLDGADWELLDDYMARGLMPNLARLVREGSSGTLETEHPPLSPLVWTTMMTGVSPLEHQILDFTHFNPSTGEKEPITSYERAVPAIWNMSTFGGKRVAVFGLWATYPAEPVHGLLVSDRLFTFLYSESEPPRGVVYPPSRESWARGAVGAAEKAIDANALREFLPGLTDAEADEIAKEENPYSKPPSALRRILIETEVYRRLATDFFAGPLPDLSIVYLQGTDSIGHIFAPFAPPKQPEVTQADYDRYHEIPEHYFKHIDDLLGQFIAIANKNHARLFLASDHGFRWKEGRPVTLSSFATATAAKWHRNEGMFLAWGPGIASTNGLTLRGGVRQTCGTLLALGGLPADSHAQGPPLIRLGGTSPSGGTPAVMDYRRWFKPLPPVVENRAASKESSEEIAKLRALGYIGSGEATSRPAGHASTRTAGSYNNAGLVLKHENRIAESIAAFSEAMKIDPNLSSAAWNLSDLLFSRNENLRQSDELLLRALQNGLPEAPTYVISRAIKYQRDGHADWSLSLLEGAVSRKPDDAELRMFRGRYRIELKDCKGALEDFVAVEGIKPNDPIAFASAGLAQVCLGETTAARASFERSLAIDPNQPQLRRFLQER